MNFMGVGNRESFLEGIIFDLSLESWIGIFIFSGKKKKKDVVKRLKRIVRMKEENEERWWFKY